MKIRNTHIYTDTKKTQNKIMNIKMRAERKKEAEHNKAKRNEMRKKQQHARNT